MSILLTYCETDWQRLWSLDILSNSNGYCSQRSSVLDWNMVCIVENGTRRRRKKKLGFFCWYLSGTFWCIARSVWAKHPKGGYSLTCSSRTLEISQKYYSHKNQRFLKPFSRKLQSWKLVCVIPSNVLNYYLMLILSQAPHFSQSLASHTSATRASTPTNNSRHAEDLE